MNKILLADVAQVYMGLSFRRYIDENASFEKVITYGSFKAYKGILTLKEESLSNDFDEKYRAKKGDILMKTISPNDAVCVTVDEGCVIGDKIAIIRLKEDINPMFLTYLLNSPYVKKQLHRLNDGKLKNVSIKDIKGLKLKIPDMNEQLKYVEILQLIDEKIKTSEEILKASKDLRDGLINNLLEVE